MFKCDNCGKRFEREDQLKYVFPDIPGLAERLDPGGIVPAGECPACGALVYPADRPIRLLILLDGGLVQDVLADKSGVEAAVLDMDTEGVEEQELVTLLDGDGEIRGTLQAHEIVDRPSVVEAAWRCL